LHAPGYRADETRDLRMTEPGGDKPSIGQPLARAEGACSNDASGRLLPTILAPWTARVGVTYLLVALSRTLLGDVVLLPVLAAFLHPLAWIGRVLFVSAHAWLRRRRRPTLVPR